MLIEFTFTTFLRPNQMTSHTFESITIPHSNMITRVASLFFVMLLNTGIICIWAEPFCDKTGMAMRMAFPTTTSSSNSCTTVLVEGWIIDTNWKRVCAFFATMLASIVHEGLVYVRVSVKFSYLQAQPDEQQLLLNRRSSTMSLFLP